MAKRSATFGSDGPMKEDEVEGVCKRPRAPVKISKDNAVTVNSSSSFDGQNCPTDGISTFVSEKRENLKSCKSLPGSGTFSESLSKKKIEYYQKLKGLNESLSKWISDHVSSNPLCILTPILQDYERHLAKIQKLYEEDDDNCTSDLNDYDKEEFSSSTSGPSTSSPAIGAMVTPGPVSSAEGLLFSFGSKEAPPSDSTIGVATSFDSGALSPPSAEMYIATEKPASSTSSGCGPLPMCRTGGTLSASPGIFFDIEEPSTFEEVGKLELNNEIVEGVCGGEATTIPEYNSYILFPICEICSFNDFMWCSCRVRVVGKFQQKEKDKWFLCHVDGGPFLKVETCLLENVQGEKNVEVFGDLIKIDDDSVYLLGQVVKELSF